ncbi:unnamed protein product [Protopolystoma xenopodis]|uniref:Uncharacterized protein n=1 Tax=Protopolystoma xenopodis TaxID=117903 RepID=A0A3S5ALF3_9PLAT|nr:unnamed protein product [Protopolystoma xenopodis]
MEASGCQTLTSLTWSRILRSRFLCCPSAPKVLNNRSPTLGQRGHPSTRGQSEMPIRQPKRVVRISLIWHKVVRPELMNPIDIDLKPFRANDRGQPLYVHNLHKPVRTDSYLICFHYNVVSTIRISSQSCTSDNSASYCP